VLLVTVVGVPEPDEAKVLLVTVVDVGVVEFPETELTNLPSKGPGVEVGSSIAPFEF
jgi:hypothetical protein